MVEIRELKIGSGKPKICVELTGRTEAELLYQVKQAAVSPAEIIEWRADLFENRNRTESVLRILKSIRMNIGSKAFLFTFRTEDEGGTVRVRDEEYIAIVKIAIDSRLIDLVDIECCVSEYRATELINYAHQHNLPVIGTNNAFLKLLTVGEMDFRVRYMQKLGADIVRIGVKPTSKKDVYRLLLATHDLCEDLDFPIAVIGFGEDGKYTRVLGELFGSSLPVGVLNSTADDGEIDVYRLASLIDNLNEM